MPESAFSAPEHGRGNPRIGPEWRRPALPDFPITRMATLAARDPRYLEEACG
jgi:hypothetical protein